jgi:hypothetical protein
MASPVAPMLDPRRRRSILYNQAIVRAVDAVRAGQPVGAKTMARLRSTTASGERSLGVDASGLLTRLAPDNPILATARQAAVTNWAGQSLYGGPSQGRYQTPDVNAATQAQLAAQSRHPALNPAMAPSSPQQAIAARRANLLGRTGAEAISSDLRRRILARMQRR